MTQKETMKDLIALNNEFNKKKKHLKRQELYIKEANILWSKSSKSINKKNQTYLGIYMAFLLFFSLFLTSLLNIYFEESFNFLLLLTIFLSGIFPIIPIVLHYDNKKERFNKRKSTFICNTLRISTNKVDLKIKNNFESYFEVLSDSDNIDQINSFNPEFIKKIIKHKNKSLKKPKTNTDMINNIKAIENISNNKDLYNDIIIQNN